ncbi:lipopolysaccharide biosynthesis protein [Marinobacter sp. 1_MG-2023]|uniref:lipopolysaccharide biosynthesis protein n=1 Tax=Marinobacter sp. 1_MG-2023 TaxID=3062627 RepID=UPI0026E2C86D|nr:oligosaccharide flippase family protein [Marinobacter sp. 1_MG-2023]MDO6823297.1 oligosaccharide flippase family protein [Marinobacter sp. 1_MG-2023]
MSGSGIYAISTLINSSIPFLLLPILTRHLTPEEYGVVAVFQVWCSLLGVFCGLNTYGAATRKYYDYDEPERYMGDYVAACVAIMIISSIILTVIMLQLVDPLLKILGLPREWLFAGILVGIGNFLVQLRLRQWQVRKEPMKYGQFQISQSAFNAGLSLLLVLTVSLGVDGRLVGITSSMLLFGVLGAILLWRDKLLTLSWKPELIKDALTFSVPLLPHFIGGFLLLTVDRAVISSILGLEAAGHYMVAAQLALALNLLLQSIHKAYVPWLFERLKQDNCEEKKHIIKISYLYFLGLVIIALFAFIFGKPALIFIAGVEYAPAGDVIGWLVLAQTILGMYFVVSSYLIYAKKTQQISKITILSGAINIVLLLTLLEPYGLAGAAWAMCVGTTVQFLATWFLASRAIAMPWSLKRIIFG